MRRIILVGKAASGKDYMRDFLTEEGLVPDISVTTRPMRKGEEDGKTYHFVSDKVFDTMEHENEFYECIRFAGKGYGTLLDSWKKSDVFIMTPSGVNQIQERSECFIVYFDISMDVRRDRLQKRSDWDTVDRRIEADEKDFEGFEDYDYLVEDPKFDPSDIYSKILKLCI